MKNATNLTACMLGAITYSLLCMLHVSEALNTVTLNIGHHHRGGPFLVKKNLT